MEYLESFLLHQQKFSKSLNKINGKSSLRDARLKMEQRHNEERRRKEQEYNKKYGQLFWL